MEEFIVADAVQVGDVIKCVCSQGCIRPFECQTAVCATNTCANLIIWETVIDILYQPIPTGPIWIYFYLTHDKVFGAWNKALLTKLI